MDVGANSSVLITREDKKKARLNRKNGTQKLRRSLKQKKDKQSVRVCGDLTAIFSKRSVKGGDKVYKDEISNEVECPLAVEGIDDRRATKSGKARGDASLSTANEMGSSKPSNSFCSCYFIIIKFFFHKLRQYF